MSIAELAKNVLADKRAHAANFRHYIELNRGENLPIFTEVAKNNGLKIEKVNEGIDFVIDGNSPYLPMIQFFRSVGSSALIEFYITCQFIGHGPKMAKLTLSDCLALENCVPTIPFSYYKQPFPTFGIDFPKEYSEKLKISTDESPEGAYPIGAVLHQVEDALLVKTQWNNGCCFVECFAPNDKNCTLEKLIETSFSKIWEDSYNILNTEQAVRARNVRLAVNFCILMTMRGFRHLGKDNPVHAEKLKNKLLKPPKHAKVTKETIQQELDSMPEIFSLDSVIPLFRKESTRKEGESTGATVKPHWRCGHFRQQHFGKGNSQIKTIFIEPILVNEDNISGPKPIGTVIYK